MGVCQERYQISEEHFMMANGDEIEARSGNRQNEFIIERLFKKKRKLHDFLIQEFSEHGLSEDVAKLLMSFVIGKCK